MDRSHNFRINPQILQKSSGGGCVLIHKVTGDCYELNELGAVVWDRLDAGESVATITEAVMPRYGISRSRLESDVGSLIADLLKHGLVSQG